MEKGRKDKSAGFKPVNPNVDFPKLEEEILKEWQQKGIVKKYLQKNKNSKERFSFLDGPITANNPMGVHHAWGRTYKDFWQRFWNMNGKKQRFQNGFDEQGLWVEVEVEKELGLRNKKDIENLVPGNKFKSLEKFINLCKERVRKFSAVQTEQSRRLGYFMDWDNSYHTSEAENNYAIWNFIKTVHDKGWLYKGHDTVPWCPRCGTAISQHEMLTEEYKEITHDTIYFKLPLKDRSNEYLLIWTTTPWTIPANVAVGINKKYDYGIWEDRVSKERFIFLHLGEERKPAKRIRQKDNALVSLEQWIMDGTGRNLEYKEDIPTSELLKLRYSASFDDLELVKNAQNENPDTFHSIVDAGKVVTDLEGTGLLHVAPGAGEEDFKLAKENNLPVIAPIEEDASYVKEMGEFSGKNAKKHPELIIDYLKQKGNGKFLLKVEKYTHRYPTCWRCKKELVWRVVDEWYIAMDRKDKSGKTYREQMIEVAKKINWMPSWGLERELDWLKNMRDWLISKKRYWGLALPIWECDKCGNFEVIGGKDELKNKSVKGWGEFDGNSPHRPWVDAIKIICEECGETASRIPDVGNPWLDAGIVPFSTMPSDWFPADFITESFPGQFKNWFYSLIAMSTAIKNKEPFKRILGFGSVKDSKGEEMHKSKGNAIEFNEAAEKAGVDIMRWLYLRTNPEHNVNFGYDVLEELRRLFLIKLWNVYSFFVIYANLHKFKPKTGAFDPSNTLDQWILSRMSGNIENLTSAIKNYDAYLAMGQIEIFITDLSNWYVRGIRDRVNEDDEEDRNEALQTLWIALTEYSKVLAPFMPFVSDEIYVNLSHKLQSVHLEDWPESNKLWENKELEIEMEDAQKIAEAGKAFRKLENIRVKQPLKGMEYVRNEKLQKGIEEIVRKELNIKTLRWKKGNSGVFVKFTVEDLKITLELKKEGEARDIVRMIQQERKKLGTALDEKVNVVLNDWPKEFEEEIKKRAMVENLIKGESFLVKRKPRTDNVTPETLNILLRAPSLNKHSKKQSVMVRGK